VTTGLECVISPIVISCVISLSAEWVLQLAHDMRSCCRDSHGGLLRQSRNTFVEDTILAQTDGVALVESISLNGGRAETTAAPLPAVVLLLVATLAARVLAIWVVLVIDKTLERGEQKHGHPKEWRHKDCPMIRRNSVMNHGSNDRENTKHSIHMREDGPKSRK